MVCPVYIQGHCKFCNLTVLIYFNRGGGKYRSIHEINPKTAYLKNSLVKYLVMALITFNKQLLDEVFVICRSINVEVKVISEPKARLIALTKTLIIWHITKTESNNCFIHFKWRKP